MCNAGRLRDLVARDNLSQEASILAGQMRLWVSVSARHFLCALFLGLLFLSAPLPFSPFSEALCGPPLSAPVAKVDLYFLYL